MSRRAWALAGGVFLFLLLRPAGIAFLRHQESARDPAGWAELATNGSFTPLVPQLMASRHHDESLYASRVRQAVLHGLPYDPYLRENRDFTKVRSWITNAISFWILACVSVLSGGVVLGWPVAAALLGAGWFLLYYGVLRWWCGKDEVAVPLALFSVLFPDLYLWLLDVNFSPAVNLERYSEVFFQLGGAIRPHFHRLPTPLLSMLLLCLLLTATARLAAFKERRTVPWLPLGLGYGLMVLVHPFEFAYGMATLGFFALLQLRRGWGGAAALAAACVVAAAYALGFLRPGMGPDGDLSSVGTNESHRFYLVTLVHLAAAGFGFSQSRRESEPPRRAAWLVLVAAQLAGFALRNAQVALGFELQLLHYIPMASFFGCMMGLLWLSRFLAERPSWGRRAGAAASLIVVVWAAANEAAAARQTYRLYGLPRELEAALRWADEELPPGSLILSLSVETNQTVPLYTRSYVQVPAIGVNHAGPITVTRYLERVARLLKTSRADAERFVAERWLDPAPKEVVRARLREEQRLRQNVDRGLMEPGEWFYPYYVMEPDKEALVEKRKREFWELYAQAEPIEPPYYLWVNAKDAHLLREEPESYGGVPLYENPEVRIYRFDGTTPR